MKKFNEWLNLRKEHEETAVSTDKVYKSEENDKSKMGKLSQENYLTESVKECDLCKNKIKDHYVDGKTKMGPWANMCMDCFKKVGVGLGLGKGQKYDSKGQKCKN